VIHFDLKIMNAYEYDQREQNIFYETPEFKMRIIDLGPGGSIPKCDMAYYVVFFCVEGEAEVEVGPDRINLAPGQGLVTEPAVVAMKTDKGVKLLGIQIRQPGTQ